MTIILVVTKIVVLSPMWTRLNCPLSLLTPLHRGLAAVVTSVAGLSTNGLIGGSAQVYSKCGCRRDQAKGLR
jgi:hypothetical protein